MAVGLARMAVLYLNQAPPDIRGMEVRHYTCTVRIERTQDLQEDHPFYGVGHRHRLLAVAECSLTEVPPTDKEGYIAIPPAKRKLCEQAIEEFARMISVCMHSPLRLTSPWPPLVLKPSNNEERSQLNDTRGLRYKGKGFMQSRIPIPFDANTAMLLEDRMGGIFLLSEALSTGYLGYVRLFERAFSSSGKRLADLLYSFLKQSERNYNKANVRSWTKFLRDEFVHADRDKPYKPKYHAGQAMTFAMSAQVSPYLAPIREAAYDVLFHKKSWADPSTERRHGLAFIPFSSAQTGPIIIYRGLPVNVDAGISDAYGTFAADPDTVLREGELSPEIWFKSEEAPDGDLRPSVSHRRDVLVRDVPTSNDEQDNSSSET